MVDHPAEPVWAVEAGMTGVQEMARSVVDVEQDRIESVTQFGREAFVDHGEEVTVYERAARIGGQFGAERHEVTVVPGDHRGESIDDVNRFDSRIAQRCVRRVPQPETADHDP